MGEPLKSTESAAKAIERVKYTHDAMIDLILSVPTMSQGQIAKHFGYTEPWVSRIFCSDAFQARLALRKAELVDPTIVATIEEKMAALCSSSLDVVHEKLTLTRDVSIGLKVLEIVPKALGYGARQQNLNIQQNFVVALPPKAASAEIWAKAHGGQEGIVDVEPGVCEIPVAGVV